MVYRCRNDHDWTMEFASEGCLALTGYAPDDFLAGNVSYGKQLIHPDDQERVWNEVQVALGERRPFQLTYRIVTRQGQERWVWEQGCGVFSTDGDLLALEGFITDISEQKRAENMQSASLSLLQATLESTADGILVVDYQGKIVSLNQQFVRMWRIPSAIVESRDGNRALAFVFDQLKYPEDFLSKVKSLYNKPETESFDILEFKDGRVFERYSKPQKIGTESVGRVWSFRDVTQRKRAEAALIIQSNILELISKDVPVPEILDALTRAVERQVPNHLCSILLLNDDQRTMRTAAAPSLPESYNKAVDGIVIGPSAGSCGTAAYRRECVIVEDIEADPLWAEWRGLALHHGLRACWSMPILSAGGRVLGTFAIYSRAPGRPSQHDMQLVETATYLVKLALERERVGTSLTTLSSAVEQTADSVFITDCHGVIQYVNPAFESLLGYSKQEAIGQNARLLKSGHHNARFYEALWQTILSGRVFRAMFTNRKKDGDIYYEEKTITPIKDPTGVITHFVSTGRDITERKRADEAREQLAAILEATIDFVGTTDAEGRFLYMNKAGRTMIGLDQKSVVTSLQIVDCHPPWASALILNEAIPKAVQHGVWSGETALLTRDGREIPVSQVILAHKASDGTVDYLSTIARDINERKAQTAALEYQANHDALTALPNRNLLNDRLRQAILTAQRDHHSLALLVLDLDRFKEINDTLGHHHGDLLLQQVGPRLRAALRESDTVARLGGDEFAVLLPTADQEGAVMTAQKILQKLEAPFTLDDLVLDVEASIGIALFSERALDAETILRHADVAMYMAKQTGSGYALYTQEHDQYSHRRLSLMGELRYAIERDQLFLHYQPTVSLTGGQVVGAEALLRWQHPKHGLVPPDQFIPLAEQTGLIKPLTEMVVNAALRQCRAWQRAGLRLSVSVNLSARTLHDPNFADQIDKLLTEHGVSPRSLEMEITESAIMADPDRAMDILSCLSIMGVRLAIDDFGVGHSSLAYLKKLPVHEIKIDKSFILNMDTDPDDVMIARSIIDLGHNQGLKVVAEGVSTQAALDRLTELGCDLVQGYFISRPMPADDFPAWMNASAWAIPKV
jgi:diguanylate cyclase (GGDEF)-like protein/PAS domain S-box-containing protein